MQKTTKAQLTEIRKELLLKQHMTCPLSLKRLTASTGCVDHCHKTGAIRSVLARGTNGVEGKISNLLSRWGGCVTTAEKSAFLRRLADYWDLHRIPQTDYIHYSHGKKKPVRRKKV